MTMKNDQARSDQPQPGSCDADPRGGDRWEPSGKCQINGCDGTRYDYDSGDVPGQGVWYCLKCHGAQYPPSVVIGQLMDRIAALEADQQDWRKGVALIASALGDKDGNLSCVRIAEVALEQHARLESASAPSPSAVQELATEALSVLAEHAQALKEYVSEHGAIHKDWDDECPADDTCNCYGKPMNAAANAVTRLALKVLQAHQEGK